MNDIMVSVLCLVYNHEKYLRKCLDGFVMQETDFKYEVIINDDASTDASADILREYEAKYPDIFKVIYQTENQYSKKKSVINGIYAKAQGKYIAFCEGDDYWTDPHKLQEQVDILENNPDCHLCTHKTVCCTENGEPIDKAYPSFHLNSGMITSEKFLKMFAKSHFIHLCSYMIDARFIHRYYPPWEPEKRVIPSPFSDASCCMFYACVGNIYYIDKQMSCHRMGSEEGWTERFNKSGISSRVERKMYGIHKAEALDKFSDYKYHDAFSEWIFGKYCFIADITDDYSILLKGENKKVLKRIGSPQFKMRVYFSTMFPHIMPRIVKKIYKRKGIDIGKI